MPNELRDTILAFEPAIRVLSASECEDGWIVTTEYAAFDAGYDGGSLRELWTWNSRGHWECEGEVE